MKNISSREAVIYKMFREIFGEKSTAAESASALAIFFLYLVYLVSLPFMIFLSLVKALRHNPEDSNEKSN